LEVTTAAGPTSPARREPIDKNRLLMYLFVGSEAFFFLALIIAFVHYSREGGKLVAEARYLDLAKTSVYSALLIASSFTLMIAEARLRRERRRSALSWLASTIVLGAVFLVGQGLEYARLVHLDVTVSRDVFGSAFFTLTGFHGFHVIVGLVVLGTISGLVASRRFRRIERSAFESAAIYWHFVDVVWIVVFTVVYLGAYL